MTPRTQLVEMTTLYNEYKRARQPSSINEHMDYLLRLALTCRHITEMGSDVGFSTCAFLFAEPDKLVTIDVVRQPDLDTLQAVAARELKTVWEHRCEDSRTTEIEETDLLFIDTGHQDDVIRIELARHAHKARRFLVFHDTVGFSETVLGDPSTEGIARAIAEWARDHPEWVLLQHFEHQYGLTAFARISPGETKPAVIPAANRPRPAAKAPAKKLATKKTVTKKKETKPKAVKPSVTGRKKSTLAVTTVPGPSPAGEQLFHQKGERLI